MQNSKIKLTALFMLVVLLTSVGVFAQRNRNLAERDGSRDKMERREHKGPMIPDLTDEQREKMKTLRLDLQKNKLPLENQLGEKKAHMRTLSTADKAEMKAINKTIEEIGSLRIQVEKLKAAHHQEVRKLLTDEQRIFLDANGPRKMKRKMKPHHQYKRKELRGE